MLAGCAIYVLTGRLHSSLKQSGSDEPAGYPIPAPELTCRC